MPPPTTLPLSTTFANSIPHHPLPSLLLNPLTPRLAFLESTLLASPPARVLARLGLGPRAIVLLAVAGLARMGSKYRTQWRALLGALGVAEAVGRTVSLLGALEGSKGEEGEASSSRRDKGKGKGRAEEPLKEEAKHVLSWWMLYAAIVVAEGFHPHHLPALELPSLPTINWRRYTRTSASTTLSHLASDLLTSLRRRLLPLLAHFPHLALRFPLLLFPAHRPTPRSGPGARRAYPQPRPFAARAGAGGSLPPALPAALVGGEVRWALCRVVLLWAGLRRDGFGASGVWEWVVGPVWAVAGRRGKERGRRVVKVVEEGGEVERDGAMEEDSTGPLRLSLSTVPIDGPDLFNLDSPTPPSPHLSPFASPHSNHDGGEW